MRLDNCHAILKEALWAFQGPGNGFACVACSQACLSKQLVDSFAL